jgi:uncharacterized protein YlxW (UPF0749 family)
MKHLEKIREMKFSGIGRQQVSILLTSVLLGFLIVTQARSFTDVTALVGRDSSADVFREIKILKTTNEKLSNEIKDLEDQLAKTSDSGKALQGIADEIKKYKLLAGRVDVKGPGIELTVNGDLKALWLTDIVNELFNAGAEAVSVNGIRLTDKTVGFDTIPSGQILLNSIILKKPFVFMAIGDKQVLRDALNQPQGILQRLDQSLGGVTIDLKQKDEVRMEKVF